jgi:hypothetical protein
MFHIASIHLASSNTKMVISADWVIYNETGKHSRLLAAEQASPVPLCLSCSILIRIAT